MVKKNRKLHYITDFKLSPRPASKITPQGHMPSGFLVLCNIPFIVVYYSGGLEGNVHSYPLGCYVHKNNVVIYCCYGNYTLFVYYCRARVSSVCIVILGPLKNPLYRNIVLVCTKSG